MQLHESKEERPEPLKAGGLWIYDNEIAGVDGCLLKMETL